MRQIHFNRENLSFALANIMAFKFRSLLTVLGIIVGIVTVVLVASILIPLILLPTARSLGRRSEAAAQATPPAPPAEGS